MIQTSLLIRHNTPGLLLLILSLFTLPAAAQTDSDFDPYASSAELQRIAEQLDAEEVDQDFLTTARNQAMNIQAAAGVCAIDATASRSSIEARYQPLKDVDADVAPTIFDQRNEIKNQLDQVIARETQCNAVYETSRMILTRIAERQSLLSQKFLSSKSQNVITLLRGAPARIAGWPTTIRDTAKPELIEDMALSDLLWLLVIAGTFAALAGLTLRYRYAARLIEAGESSEVPGIATLIAGPSVNHAPLLLEGLTLFTILSLTVADTSTDLVVVRVAIGIFLYGLGGILIDWATGPLSPASRIEGLIPDHVRPLRTRLRFIIAALLISFITLGTGGSAERTPGIDPLMFFIVVMLVAVTLLSTLNYLSRIPGLQGRFRLVRYFGSLVVLIGIAGLCIGYQNFAGFLIHGVTMTCLALLLLWIGLWLVLVVSEYLIDNDTPAAERMRVSLGITEQGSRTGAGFLQLVADLFFWLSFIVFLIYVWDQSGNTLNRLLAMVMTGGTVGNIRLVPVDVITGILIFAAMLIVVGWIKHWIDRRWLQHIVVDRGARDALITLFGYVGFIVALLLGLTQAGVDLGGIAIISGALAVGIGFGLQAIVNNFVSGLILLFERPIKSGDFVTVGDTEGFIRRIRIRATEIETLDNQNVLVPNSELVSGRVTNWVLRDTHGRLRIGVGVAYGSDVEKVREILETIACNHPDVITDGRAPAPRALFMRFGDSSLDFELRVRIQRIERRFTVISDINFALNQAFKDAKITIPFPQRDLHLITLPEQQAASAIAVPTMQQAPQEEKTPPHSTIDQITRSHRHELEANCEPERIWQALIDIDQLKRWLIRDGSFLPRIGGSFKFQIRDETDVSGRVDIFLPPRRMRMVLSPQDGEEPLSSGPITVEFFIRDRDGKSLLTVTVAGIPATEDWEHYYRSSEDRWENGLKELRSLLLQK